MRRVLFWAFVLIFPTAGRAELLPVELFCRSEAVSGMQLSPDGRMLTYFELSEDGESLKFVLQDLDTGKQRVVKVGEGIRAWNHWAASYWTNSRRVLFWGYGAWMAMDRDGKRALSAVGLGSMIHRFFDEKAGMMLMTGFDATSLGPAESKRPDVHRVDSRTGSYTTVEQNPGTVLFWYANPQGEVTCALEYIKGKTRVIARENAQTPWAALPGMDWGDTPVRPLGYGAQAKMLYTARQSPHGTWGVYPYDLERSEFGEPLVVHPRYDAVPSNRYVTEAGALPLAMMYSATGQDLLGIHHHHQDHVRTLWLDLEMEKLQVELGQALPGRVNVIVSMSDDRQRLVVASYAANDPGSFYLFDRRQQTGDLITAVSPWIDPEKMAHVRKVEFAARDGALLDAFITIPRGQSPKQLPLVVLPGNSLREPTGLGFDGTAQFLANRGYAVLRINTRGLRGYGEAFWNDATKDLGRLVQTDLADGARWAIQAGLADPSRIGLVGGGAFAGYRVLMNLANEPDLFRCGFARSPYVEWSDLAKGKKADENDYEFFTQWLGEPDKLSEAQLRSISPLYLADKIKSPVKIMHLKQTSSRDYRLSKTFVEALGKAGGKVEFLNDFKAPLTPVGWTKKQLEEIEVFLAKHMPVQ